jgi:gas vesicle protein GvpL/GvpF
MPALLYCVTQTEPAVSVARGICESVVESSAILGVRVYWSTVEDVDACLGAPDAMKQAALQFHQVLREILTTITPIPFRFPTLLDTSDSLEQHLASEQELYREALERVNNALQYEIIATWADDQQPDRAAPVSGREYLKRRQQEAGRITAVESKLKSVTADSVREWRSRQDRKTHRWFALVGRECRERFIAALRSAGGSEGVRLRLSGPWPPSEFVTARGPRG